MYLIMISGNGGGKGSLSFMFKAADGSMATLDETRDFKVNDVVGNIFVPFTLTAPAPPAPTPAPTPASQTPWSSWRSSLSTVLTTLRAHSRPLTGRKCAVSKTFLPCFLSVFSY